MKTTTFLFLAFLSAASALAADLKYPTLVPQDTDNSELIYLHKAQVSQAKLANGNAFCNATLLTGTSVTVSGTTPGTQAFALTTTGTFTVTGTCVLSSTSGVLEAVNVNQGLVGSKLVLLDGTAVSSGTTIATLLPTTSATRMLYNIRFANGLTIVLSGTGTGADITVSYRQ